MVASGCAARRGARPVPIRRVGGDAVAASRRGSVWRRCTGCRAGATLPRRGTPREPAGRRRGAAWCLLAAGTMGSVRPERFGPWGALAGFALGAVDTALLVASGVEMTLAGRNATLLVGATFTSSFALLGFLSGSLAAARARARADAATIRGQQEALAASQRAAFENEKLAAIGRLAAGIAHEVRNPLGVIRASAALVQEHFAPGEDAHRACRFVVEETERLDGLIASLLAFARPTALERRRASVADVVERAALLADELVRR